MQICTLTGNLEDVGLANFDGTLKATLDLSFIDDSTIPDTLVLPSVFTWNIVNGLLVDVELRETETVNIAVHFELFPTGSDTPIYQIYAIVPNLETYEFAQFLDSGVTNDTLATGALRIAQIMFSNAALIGTITEALNLYRQSAAPVNGTLNDTSVWIDTISGDLWQYSTVRSNWQSYIKEFVKQAEITAGSLFKFDFGFTSSFRSVALRRLFLNYAVTAPNDTENYWELKVVQKNWNSSDVTDLSGLSTRLSSLDSPDTLVQFDFNLNRDLNLNLVEFLALSCIPVGTPGNLRLHTNLRYLTLLGV